MRKTFIAVLVSMIISLNAATAFAQSTPKINVNKENVSSGVVGIEYSSDSKKQLKVMLEKDGKNFVFDLNNSSYDNFPLLKGSGEYKVNVLENIEGNKYKFVYTGVVNAEIENKNDVYLNSIQIIKWDEDSKPAKKARELAKNCSSEEQTIKAIYDYITNNMKYDFDKLKNLTNYNGPEPEKLLDTKKGICYDFASLFAIMLRSSGIPTKLIKGYTSNARGYHAWNEVYLSSKDKWITVDTTYDAQMKGAKVSVSMEKDSDLYKKEKEY